MNFKRIHSSKKGRRGKRRSLQMVAACISLLFAGGTALNYAGSTFVIVSGKGNYWKAGTFTEGTGGTTITVNENDKKQKWLGFGGTFNEAGWSALSKLPASERNRAIKLLFDKNDGIGFTWGRIPIGASDYALERYTLNQTKDDFEMKNFSISRDKQYLIPYIKGALEVKPDLKFWASAWTPPTWMKTGATDAAGYDGGEMKNDPKYLAANALYTARFCEEYKAENIPISFVFPQNEPGYTQYYPTCGWGKYRLADGSGDVNKAEYLSTYVADYLEDTLKKRVPETGIWFGTLSNDKFANDYWNGMKSKPGAKDFVKGLGLQWNCITLVKGAASLGYLTMCSEHQCGNYPWKPEATNIDAADREHFYKSMAPNNHLYGEESWDLIKAWIREGVNIYSAWNMVLDYKGLNLDKTREWPQNALLAVDTRTNPATLNVTPYYYVVRHIIQYVDTGAYFIGTTGGDALAFKNPDGSISVAAFNSGTNQATMTIAVGGKNYKINVPGRGWATLVTNWTPPVAINNKSLNTGTLHSGKSIGIRISSTAEGYSVSLPSGQVDRIELLSLRGQLLESRAVPKGSRNTILPRKENIGNGTFVVRVVAGSQIYSVPIAVY